jgi:arylsulfatase A-like enzyme
MGQAPEKAPEKPQPNILLIIGDDMGVESLATYGVGPADEVPTTKNLDTLAANGVSFDNFWSQAVCSPTRATMITGRYGFRTGIGGPLDATDGPLPELLPKPEGSSYEDMWKPGDPGGPPMPDPLPGEEVKAAKGPGAPGGERMGGPPPMPTEGVKLSEFTLPKAFDGKYSTAAIGKWHMASPHNGWIAHPNNAGFDYYSGLIAGFPEGYFSWIQVTDGEAVPTTGYTPTRKVDDALEWIEKQNDKPWLMWFAFNLPHDPLHLPPADLLQEDHSDVDPMANPLKTRHQRKYFDAMMETMDTEIGRLLAGIDSKVLENTYVIFMGDNGTSRGVIGTPFSSDHAKGSLYQGGLNVPLIISGPGVKKGERSTALVNSVDMFSTIIEMAGMDVSAVVPKDVTLDSVSALPYLTKPDTPSQRDFVLAEIFGDRDGKNVGDHAIRNATHKLITFSTNKEELYNLKADPYEHNNLLAGNLSADDQAQYDALKKLVSVVRADADF